MHNIALIFGFLNFINKAPLIRVQSADCDCPSTACICGALHKFIKLTICSNRVLWVDGAGGSGVRPVASNKHLTFRRLADARQVCTFVYLIDAFGFQFVGGR